MTRSMKLAALTAALAVLSVGPGCGMFDGYCDDCNSSNSYGPAYQTDGLPTPRDVGTYQPTTLTPGTAAPTGAGVYSGTAPQPNQPGY